MDHSTRSSIGNTQARQKILEYEWWFDDAAGNGRRKKGARLHKVNVVLCTPEMVNLPAGPGEPSLAQTHWRCLVVDERIVEPDQFNRELEAFRYDHMLLLTGTPLQNNPQELFSLIHFSSRASSRRTSSGWPTLATSPTRRRSRS